MLVDRETGELKPTYSYGDLVVLASRVDCFDGLDLMIELYEEEEKLYPVPLRGHIVGMFLKCNVRLNLEMKRK